MSTRSRHSQRSAPRGRAGPQSIPAILDEEEEEDYWTGAALYEVDNAEKAAKEAIAAVHRNDNAAEAKDADEDLDSDDYIERLRRPQLRTGRSGSKRLPLRIEGVRIKRMAPVKKRMQALEILQDHKGRFRQTAALTRITVRNRVREISTAVSLFESRNWTQCHAYCKKIVNAGTSEAITARASMMLAAIPEGPLSIQDRLDYMDQALQNWTMVINRKGRSRYPFLEALKELRIMQLHMNTLTDVVFGLHDESSSSQL